MKNLSYEDLLDEAFNSGFTVKEKDLQGSDGRIAGNRIAIRKSLDTSRQKMCVLAEELGHSATGTGDILDQSDLHAQKDELKGRKWAYNKVIPFHRILDALQHGYRYTYDIADYLDVDEQFLRDALQAYGLM